MLKRLFSTYQVAKLLGASEAAVADWIRKGWLPVRDVPGEQVCISEKGLVQFLKDRGVDMEAIMSGVDADDVGQQLPEPVLLPPLAASLVEPVSESLDESTAEEPAPAEPPPPSPVAIEELEQCESPPADPAAKLAEAVLQDAVARKVSHIHLDSCRDGLSLRVRIDGVLSDKPNFKSRLPDGLGPRLIAHFKTLAGLEVGEPARPQTGRFCCSLNGGDVGFRLATCPTDRGERLVIHVLDREEDVSALSQIGLEDDDLSLLRRLLGERCGIIMIAGLPGDGRTTTLRAMIAELNIAGRDLIALESRSEIRLEGVSRCHIGLEKGFTAADALRAVRDQDVDVIILDDLTDHATATGAIEAALNGQMVLAGIFARNAVGAMKMMLESAHRWAMASVLLGVINQRMVRRICPKCRREAKPPADLSAKLNIQPQTLDFPVYRSSGCDECSQTGYAGRTGLFSVLHVDTTIAAMLRNDADALQIISAAEQAGMKTLHQTGLEKVRNGITSLEELARVFPPEL